MGNVDSFPVTLRGISVGLWTFRMVFALLYAFGRIGLVHLSEEEEKLNRHSGNRAGSVAERNFRVCPQVPFRCTWGSLDCVPATPAALSAL